MHHKIHEWTLNIWWSGKAGTSDVSQYFVIEKTLIHRGKALWGSLWRQGNFLIPTTHPLSHPSDLFLGIYIKRFQCSRSRKRWKALRMLKCYLKCYLPIQCSCLNVCQEVNLSYRELTVTWIAMQLLRGRLPSPCPNARILLLKCSLVSRSIFIY